MKHLLQIIMLTGMMSLNAQSYEFDIVSDYNKTGNDYEFTLVVTSDFINAARNSALQYLKLGISTTDNAYTTDFYFDANASVGLDPGYDASIWGGVAPAFAVYSLLVENDTGIPLALQALHPDDMYNISIPLGVNANANETLSFDIIDATIPSAIKVYLEDTLTNTTTLLTEESYQITPSQNLNGTGRFYLRFEDESLSETTPELEKLKIYTDSSRQSIVVNGQLSEQTIFKLYDLQGRLVMETELEQQTIIQYIDVSTLNAGVYIVELNKKRKRKRKTKKLILN